MLFFCISFKVRWHFGIFEDIMKQMQRFEVRDE